MNKIKLGNISIVNPREIWINEKRNFKPWLSENVELISSTIGIPIVVEQTEKEN